MGGGEKSRTTFCIVDVAPESCDPEEGNSLL